MTEFDLNLQAHLLLLCCAASVAGFVRGFSGFGGPATISLLLAHLFAPATLLPKIIMLDFYAYPLLVWNARKDANWRLSLPIAAVTVAMLPLGVHTMQSADPATLKRMIAVACLLAIAVNMSGYRLQRIPPLAVNLLVACVLGWALSATFIALPMISYFLLMPMTATQCRATVISFSITMTPFMVGYLIYRETLQMGDVLPTAAAGACYFAMIWLGSRAFKRASDRNYRRGAQWLLLVLATSVLL